MRDALDSLLEGRTRADRHLIYSLVICACVVAGCMLYRALG